ncbi:shikimate dehydrogenase family protein [Thalassovita aquimarina]|uniref:Shikimate dehydrogenase n=1 Tax=Thalassovita aquimarina TaxID=2785917 RepID=A0ABS5HUV9_9RHOB|nr:hypothetical protein [Thalassovita aquimarina]MBR9652767.1 shikimate dehydrogenase [Thalassovita aquimarina]
MDITGKTKLFPIIGSPVDTVFSPGAFNEFFRGKGIDARMIALEIPSDALGDFWALLRASSSFLGCSVTYPHKQAAFGQVDALTPRASRLGAINTINRGPDGRLTGDATDGVAMRAALRAAGGSVRGKTAVILGAGGGAGQAIADAFCEAGIRQLCLIEPDDGRRAAVVDMIAIHWPDVSCTEQRAGAEILVNATTLGKSADDAVPFGEDDLEQAEIVCDVVTGPSVPPLLLGAEQRGALTVSGAQMGAQQIPAQLSFIGQV